MAEPMECSVILATERMSPAECTFLMGFGRRITTDSDVVFIEIAGTQYAQEGAFLRVETETYGPILVPLHLVLLVLPEHALPARPIGFAQATPNT